MRMRTSLLGVTAAVLLLGGASGPDSAAPSDVVLLEAPAVRPEPSALDARPGAGCEPHAPVGEVVLTSAGGGVSDARCTFDAAGDAGGASGHVDLQ